VARHDSDTERLRAALSDALPENVALKVATEAVAE